MGNQMSQHENALIQAGFMTALLQRALAEIQPESNGRIYARMFLWALRPEVRKLLCEKGILILPDYVQDENRRVTENDIQQGKTCWLGSIWRLFNA